MSDCAKPGFPDGEGWMVAGRLIQEDVLVRRALGARPGESTLQAAERVAKQLEEAEEWIEQSRSIGDDIDLIT